jgi:D-alanyl-D-alanine carboxypeptidase (penicillin-binding protein 5/6)
MELEAAQRAGKRGGLTVRSKKVVAALIATVLCVLFPTQAIAAIPDSRDLAARAALVMCFETGEILYGYNEHMPWHPASTMKMMTVYMVYDAMAEGHFTLDCIVPISDRAFSDSRRSDLSNIALARNGNYTVSELLDIVIVASASGASRALAEKVGGGDINQYLRMANDVIAGWGVDARINCSIGGWLGNGNYFTAHAMAVLAQKSIQRFPEILARTGASYINFRGRHINHHVPTRYPGMDGFKTGTSSSAGANFIGTAERDGVRIISVVLGSTQARRFDETAVMLDYGFAVLNGRRTNAEALNKIHCGQVNRFDMIKYN